MPGLVRVGTGEEVVEIIIRYDAVNEEALTVSKDRLEAVKAAAAGTAQASDGLTRSAGRQDLAFRTMSSSLLILNSGLNRMGILSDSTANSLNTLIGMVQLLRVAQSAYTAVVNAETGAQWGNAVARAAAWIAANPVFGAIVVGAIAAGVAAVAALKVSGALGEGGTTLAPGRFLVGEKGMELVDLPAAASVTPLTGGGGGGKTVIINTIGDPRSWDRGIRDLLE